MQAKVYNTNGEEAGSMELPDGVFGLKWNPDLVYQVVTGQTANMRVHVAHAKDRAQVRGGGKKPWRQKGTGRARHGSIRSPIWKGGGVTHGPLTEKNFKKKINKKMAKKALFTVLSAKARDHEIVVLDDVRFSEAKTKFAAKLFSALVQNNELSRIMKGNGALIALVERDDMVKRALKNLPYVGLDLAKNLNAHEVLQYKYTVFPKKAIDQFTALGNSTGTSSVKT
ncbi:MAG: 50S ribosomal protein L4 [Candidatus Sungbacteria bacterium]|nr:50S ribosomal protein L4 [bacterium]MDZ4285655.1 50S ribosomal protein L4 [Candidatus Sungbacteria bacterium]